MKQAHRNISFSFEIPVSTKLPGAKIAFDIVGVIAIAGTATLNFTEDPAILYTSIRWNDADIKNLVEQYEGADELSQSIYNATMNHIRNTFDLQYLEKHKNADDFADAIRDEGGVQA